MFLKSSLKIKKNSFINLEYYLVFQLQLINKWLAGMGQILEKIFQIKNTQKKYLKKYF